jgi:hypothetical protein
MLVVVQDSVGLAEVDTAVKEKNRYQHNATNNIVTIRTQALPHLSSVECFLHH